MISYTAILDEARRHIGKPYRYGAEANPKDTDPPAFDCSELVEYVCRRLGVVPQMVDGARFQLAHCAKHGTLLHIVEARVLPGALLFRRNKTTKVVEHVAFVKDAQGGTIEARGKDYGVGEWPWRPNWTDGALIPGVDYSVGDVKTL